MGILFSSLGLRLLVLRRGTPVVGDFYWVFHGVSVGVWLGLVFSVTLNSADIVILVASSPFFVRVSPDSTPFSAKTRALSSVSWMCVVLVSPFFADDLSI